MGNTPKSFEFSYPENAREAFVQENNPLPAEEWNPAWDAEIEAEKTNPSLLKRISDAIPTPVKAAAAGTILAATQLLSPESAEAIPVPPDIPPLAVAVRQNIIYEGILKNNNFNTAEELAYVLKNNTFRGRDVRIKAELDIYKSNCGVITGKRVSTFVTRNDGDFAHPWVNSNGVYGRITSLPGAPRDSRRRMFDIISENGIVRKEYQGTIEF